MIILVMDLPMEAFRQLSSTTPLSFYATPLPKTSKKHDAMPFQEGNTLQLTTVLHVLIGASRTVS